MGFRPLVEVVDMIADIAAMLAKARPFPAVRIFSSVRRDSPT